MDLSVIVPIYNSSEFLEKSLQSLKSQSLTKKDIEFILIDDGSSDSSLEIMKKFAEVDERFVIVSRENRGYGATLNEGIEKAHGEYIGVLEPDDFICGQMHFELLELAKKNDLDVIRSDYEKFWGQIGRKEYVSSEIKGTKPLEVFDPSTCLDCLYLEPAIWSMLFKKSLIAKHGIRALETPGAAFQDTSFSFKLWACSKRAMHLNKAYVNYRQDNENSSINNPGISEFVSYEYQEIFKFINSNIDNDRKDSLYQIAMRRQFLAYVWNYERLDKSVDFEFAKVAHADLKEGFDAGYFNEKIYESWEVSDLKLLVESAESFVKFKDSTPRILRKIKHLKDKVKR